MPVFIHTSETSKYILCTLSKTQQLQQPLKVIINAGENVHFSLNCEKGKVHLTGYFLADMMGACDHEHGEEHAHGSSYDNIFESQSESDDDDDDDDDDDEEEDDDDDDDEEEDESDEEEAPNGKRKALEAAKSDKNGTKKLKEDIPKLVPNKVIIFATFFQLFPTYLIGQNKLIVIVMKFLLKYFFRKPKNYKFVECRKIESIHLSCPILHRFLYFLK